MSDKYLPHNKRFTIATMSAALVVLCVVVLGYWKIQQDDSYIFYSFAENIANGNGYVFNAGERLNATTSPLYTILLSFIYKILRSLPFVTLPLVGHFIGGVSLFLTCLFLMKSLKGASFSTVPYVLPLVFLANPLLANAVGMETFLAIMLSVLGLYLYSREKFVAASLAVSFSVLGRPDMVLLAAVLAVQHAVRKRRLPCVSVLCAFLIPVLAWAAFSAMYFGHVVPSTLAAKLGQTESARWGTGLIFLKGLWSPTTWHGHTRRDVMVTLLAVGAILLLPRYRRWSIPGHSTIHVILLWSILYLMVYGLILNPPAYPWYYTPFALGCSVIVSLLAETVVRLLPSSVLVTNGWLFGAALFGLASAGVVLPLETRHGPVTYKYENYKLAAEWLNGNAPEGSTVGASEIGVLRYYYKKGPVIDALGIVTPGAAQHVRRRDYSWYVHQYEPDYLMFSYPHQALLEDMVEDAWFKEAYVLKTVLGTGYTRVAMYARVGSS